MSFFRQGDLLFWQLNGQIREAFHYKGNYSFEGGNIKNNAKFYNLPNGSIKVVVIQLRYQDRKEYKHEGTKILKYQD